MHGSNWQPGHLMSFSRLPEPVDTYLITVTKLRWVVICFTQATYGNSSPQEWN